MQRLWSLVYPTDQTLVWDSFEGASKPDFSSMLEHGCVGVILELPQQLALPSTHSNAARAPLNHDDGGLLPDTYLRRLKRKGGHGSFGQHQQ